MTDISHPVTNDSFWPTEEFATSGTRYLPQEASPEGSSDYPLTPTTPTGQTEYQTENPLNCPGERKTERLVRHLNARITHMWDRGTYSQALPLAYKAVELAESCLADNFLEYHKSLSNLAGCLRAAGQYETALVYLTRAIELGDKTGSSYNLDWFYYYNLGMLYYNRAMTYEDLGDYGMARHDVKMALSLWEPTLENDSHLLKNARTLKERVSIEEDPKADEIRRVSENQLASSTEESESPPDFMSRIEEAKDTAQPNPSDEYDKAWKLYQQKKYAEAIVHLERTLQIETAGDGANDPLAVASMGLLADIYSDTNQLEKARDLYLQLLTIRESKNPETDEVATTYNNLGFVYERLGDIPLAIEAYQKSLAIDEKNHGPLSERVALTVSNLALLYYDQDQYEDALPLDKRLVAIRRHLYGDEDPRVVDALTSLGFTYEKMEEYESALSCFDQAYAIYLKAYGQYHIKTVLCLSDKANIYMHSGNYQRAKEIYDEFARAIRQVDGYRNSVDIAVALSDYADLLSALDDYPQARGLVEEALEIVERQEGQQGENYIYILESYYTILGSMGDYDLAREMATKVVTLQENSPIPGSHSLENARLWLELFQAIEIEEGENIDSQRIAEIYGYGILDPFAPDFQLTLDNLPPVYFRYMEDFEKNGTHNTVLLDKLLSSLGELDYAFTKPITYEKILALQMIASLFYMNGMTKEAIDVLKRLKIWVIIEIGPGHKWVAEIDQRISFYYHLDHKKDAAKKYASLALKTSQRERDRVLSAASEREAFALLAQKRTYLDHFLSLYHDKADAAEAYNAVLDWKGFVAQTIQSRREDVYENPEAQAVFEKLKTKQREIAQIAYANELPQDGANVRDRLVALTVEKEALERQLAALSPQYAADQEVFRAKHAQIANALPTGAVLVDYFKFNDSLPADDNDLSQDHYLAFIIQGGKSGSVRMLDLGPAEAIDKAIESYRERVASAKANTYWGRLIDQEANLVRSLVWDPVSVELGDAKTVFVVPDAAITGVSFAGLPSELASKETQYLVEDYTFGYLENAKGLMRFPDNQTQLGQGALVVGAVNYDEPPTELAKIENTNTADTGLAYRGGRAVACNQTDYRLYPGMEVEPLRVSELFQTAHVETMQLTGSDASEQNVYLQGRNRRYLHLATHGFFATSEGCGGAEGPSQFNPMVLSGVVLAGANAKENRTDGATDGILTAEEVSGLDLRGTELVVLAACETGLGEVKSGEGVMGLRRAFFLAGARTLVMSLWNVEDESALRIMQDYYKQELSPDNKLNKLEVLRQAQLRLLQDNRDRYDHGLPYTWAEFVSAGDWQ